MDKWEYLDLQVTGSTRMDELLLLAHYASKVPENGTILDIGTCEGRSAFALALGSKPSVKIVTIDPTPNPRFYMHRKKLEFDEKIECIERRSQDIKWDRSFDMFFNDGLHSQIGIVEDNDIYCPFVLDGGLCMFHDFKLYNNTVGAGILTGEGKYYERVKVVDNIYIGRKI